MNALVHDEKCLYPRIQDLMENRGYEVVCQFETFSPLTRSTRKLDVLGFRWTQDGDLDAWAVEAKQGELPADTLTALGQAIEYQLYVPHVSVAAEVCREDLAFAENPIRVLGLGYIHATPASATEIIAPVSSPRCYQSEFNQVIRHAGVLCLVGRSRWRDCREHHSGGRRGRETFGAEAGEAIGYPFYCIHTNDPVQYMLTTTGESGSVRIEVWIDRKEHLTRIYRHIESDQLANLHADTHATAAILVFKRNNWGRLGDCLEKRQLPPTPEDVADALEYARSRLDEERVVPTLSFAHDLWPWDSMPRKEEAEQKVQEAIDRLEPVRAYLAAMAK